MYVPDNYDAYLAYERDRVLHSELLEKITETEDVISSAICTLEDAEPTEEVREVIKVLNNLLKRL